MTKIARIALREGTVQYGVLQQDERTLQLIEGDIFQEWQTTDVTVSLDKVKLLPPVAPPNIIAIGLNYRAHAIESGAPIPERPVIFIKATTALCAPGDPITLPRVAANEVDYECELAIIIGKKARHVSEEKALDYVLGYTCANDVSARDCQRRLDQQWARAKSFDTFAPLGPWLASGIDPENLRIQTRLNGKTMQDSNTDDLIFSCRRLISYISDSLTLLPGTVIMTGTPSGVGFARKPPVFLKPGDMVEVEIEGIGILRNPVIAEP